MMQRRDTFGGHTQGGTIRGDAGAANSYPALSLMRWDAIGGGAGGVDAHVSFSILLVDD